MHSTGLCLQVLQVPVSQPHRRIIWVKIPWNLVEPQFYYYLQAMMIIIPSMSQSKGQNQTISSCASCFWGRLTGCHIPVAIPVFVSTPLPASHPDSLVLLALMGNSGWRTAGVQQGKVSLLIERLERLVLASKVGLSQKCQAKASSLVAWAGLSRLEHVCWSLQRHLLKQKLCNNMFQPYPKTTLETLKMLSSWGVCALLSPRHQSAHLPTLDAHSASCVHSNVKNLRILPIPKEPMKRKNFGLEAYVDYMYTKSIRRPSCI